MDSQKITCFLEIVRTRSFTQAADNLFLSQSAISRNIAAIENELNMKLFDRRSKYLTLTPAGKILSDGLAKIREDYRNLVSAAKEAQTGYTGEIRIGILQEFMMASFPRVLNAFEKEHPDINIVIVTEPVNVLREKLLNGEINFVLGGQEDMDIVGEPNIHIGGRKIGLVISAHHPLVNADRALTLEDFKNDTFVTLPDNVAPARKNLLIRCAKRGFVPKVVTAQDFTTLMMWVELNRCVSILYENTTIIGNPYIRFIEMEEIVPADASISWCEKHLDESCRIFIEFLHTIKW